MVSNDKNYCIMGSRKFTMVHAALSLLTMIILLLLMERSFFSESGKILLWVSDTMSSENSQQFTDPYSFSHLQHGLVFFWFFYLFRDKLSLSIRFLLSSMIEVSWEIIENTKFIIDRYREATAALGYYGDTILNCVGDLLSCWLGFYLAFKLGFKKTLILFCIIEVMMILLIKDSLLLNVIMLIHPIDAIREWQLL